MARESQSLPDVNQLDLPTWRSQFASEIVGESPEIIEALETIQHVAATDCTILLTGEPGTGKELFARAAHRASPRRMPCAIAATTSSRSPTCASNQLPTSNLDLGSSLDLRSALESLERQLIDRALQKASGNRTEAAALLGLDRTTLVEKLRKVAA